MSFSHLAVQLSNALSIFHFFDPSRSPKVKYDGANRKSVGHTCTCSRDQRRICHHFQDILNQRIVISTLTCEGHPKWRAWALCVISVWSNIVTITVFDIFHIKKYDLSFWLLKVIKGQIWRCQSKAYGCFQKRPPGVRPPIYHRFQDISNQRIVTLTYNLSSHPK